MCCCRQSLSRIFIDSNKCNRSLDHCNSKMHGCGTCSFNVFFITAVLSLKTVLSGTQQTTLLHHLLMWLGERHTVTALSCVKMFVGVCCITVPSFMAHLR